MVWLLPAALSGLLLIAGPVAIHLFTRRHARRVPFPTIRFVRESKAAALRLRRPSDLPLLAVRCGIVAAAAIAAAQPLILVPWRVSSWNARIVRALVIDTSSSMRRPDATGVSPAALAVQSADAEAAAAYQTSRIETPDLEEGIARAVQRLDQMPPARREVVVFSDFRQGTLDERAVAAIPSDVGLRFVRVGRLPRERKWTTPEVDGWRGGRWRLEIAIDESSTAATWTRVADAPSVTDITVAAAPSEEQQAQAALKAASAFGVLSGHTKGETVMAFRGAPRPQQFARAQPLATTWVVQAAGTLRNSELIQAALENGDVTGGKDAAATWTSLVRDSSGRSVVLAAEDRGTLLIETTAPASSLFAPALVRAALLSRDEGPAQRENEILSIADEQLARWRRSPGSVTPRAWSRADSTDARWFWIAALVLLVLEGQFRRRQVRSDDEESHVRAA